MVCPDCFRESSGSESREMREVAIIGYVKLWQCYSCKRVESEVIVTGLHPADANVPTRWRFSHGMEYPEK